MSKVSNWTPDEVWEWLQSKHFFEGFDHEDWDDVTGHNLLEMGKDELINICPRRFPIESLLEAIDQLKQKGFTSKLFFFCLFVLIYHVFLCRTAVGRGREEKLEYDGCAQHPTCSHLLYVP